MSSSETRRLASAPCPSTRPAARRASSSPSPSLACPMPQIFTKSRARCAPRRTLTPIKSTWETAAAAPSSPPSRSSPRPSPESPCDPRCPSSGTRRCSPTRFAPPTTLSSIPSSTCSSPESPASSSPSASRVSAWFARLRISAPPPRTPRRTSAMSSRPSTPRCEGRCPRLPNPSRWWPRWARTSRATRTPSSSPSWHRS